jgi:tetratricopeptide (TPR) repeat protein
MLWRLRKSQGIFPFLILLFAIPVSVHAAQTGEVSAARPAEYMIYQYPDISLVVRIDVPEAEFSSMVFGPEEALIKASRVPDGRIGPLYQFIDAVDMPRQLMIKVNPGRKIDRSQINLELIQLPAGDRNSVALAQAYKLLSFGTERVHASDTTTWATKTYTLKNAARAFAELGWEEMRLWSDYFAAHLVLHRLDDVLMSMELAREIRYRAERAGFEMIELAALVLEGDALMQAGENASAKPAYARYEQAHEILVRVARLAEELDLRSEQSRALFTNGLAYERQAQWGKAVEQYQLALDASVSAGDSELANHIRSRAASVYETLGSTSGAIEMLEEISSDLAGETGEEERGLAENLFEKGRILNYSFRYPEAARELSEALQIQQANPAAGAWGPTGLALAWSHYSMGEMELAAHLIQESIPRTARAGNTMALTRAYGIMANIFRQRGEFAQMVQYREKQGSLVDSGQQRALFLFESAVDARSKDGPHSKESHELMRRSRDMAIAGGDILTGQRAILHLCLLDAERNAGGNCTGDKARRALDYLRDSGIPALALEANFAWSKIMRRKGNKREALRGMERLITDMSFYRLVLPGVLGAWYWENKAEIFQEYMSVALAQSGAGFRKSVDGRLVLLSLERIRLIEAAEGTVEAKDPVVDERDENLRVLLARRITAAEPGQSRLAAELNDRFDALRERSGPIVQPLEAGSLDEFVSGLDKDEAVLTYYFARTSIHALSAGSDGIYLLQLADSARILELLQDLKIRIARGDSSLLPELGELGLLMLKPVSRRLAKNTYLIPTGPLNGFPFDALRIDDRFLAEKRQVINLMSVAGLQRRHAIERADGPDSVFLAGNPQTSQKLFSYDIPVSAEIDAVTDLFVGPGLHIIQGVALAKDEFRDPRFAGASIVHLAIPGSLDLAYPERSRLWMSATANDPATVHLAPREIRTLDCTASLLVLSGTGIVGNSNSSFESRLGIVSDFLDSCMNPVMATLWPAGDSETAVFMGDFYHRLESSSDIAEALVRTKRSRIETETAANFRSWAGFQLYIR